MTTASFVAPLTLAAVAAAAVLFVVLAIGAVTALHRRALTRVPVRVHVAGTRGKSSVTRLVAAGLRADGRRVLARTTGTEPRLILPDGTERPWRRLGPASVREYEGFMRLAARQRADAVVLECMAIKPKLVWTSEHLLLRATHTVVTNVRPDHEEDLGSGRDAVAESLALAVPAAAQVVAADDAVTPEIEARVKLLGSRLATVPVEGLLPGAANRRLAQALCTVLGCDEKAVAAIEASPQANGFRIYELTVSSKPLRFADAFACNDPASLAVLWDAHMPPVAAPSVVVLNARADRPLRSRAMLEFVSRRDGVQLFLTGDGLPWLRRAARKAGFEAIGLLNPRRPDAALERLAAAATPASLVWGIGNHQGFGAALGRILAKRAAPC